MNTCLKFRLVEGDYTDLPIEKVRDFERDYLNPSLTSHEVRMKYGLSKRQYSRVTQKIRDKYGLIRRPYAQSKHFYRQGNRWYIIKTIRNERILFGSLPTAVFSKDDMEIVIDKCRDMSWNIGECIDLIQSLGGNTIEHE